MREALWSVLDSWSPAQQLAFLLFVTGVPAAPTPGTEVLRVEAPFTAFGAGQQALLLLVLGQTSALNCRMWTTCCLVEMRW